MSSHEPFYTFDGKLTDATKAAHATKWPTFSALKALYAKKK